MIRRPPVPSGSRPRTLKCFSQKQSVQEFERLFSNLNQATMKREPGESLRCCDRVVDRRSKCKYNVSMAMRTLGNFGVQAACWSYIFIHYALLVAYVARSSEILTNTFNIPLYEDSI
ncbi:hypothetical protein BHM03_00018077 [Ensete ventricosum]|nr:hypothetical protein BHM03_00018077 [Ensete ventricosum]